MMGSATPKERVGGVSVRVCIGGQGGWVTIFEQECYQNVYMPNSGPVFNITSESSGAERISLRDCYCAQILCATQQSTVQSE